MIACLTLGCTLLALTGLQILLGLVTVVQAKDPLRQLLVSEWGPALLLYAVHAFFFIRILFIRIIRLRSEKNKNNLRIIKAQILPEAKPKIIQLWPRAEH